MIQTIHIDGQDWVPKEAYDTVRDQLAEKQRSQASHNRYFAHIIDLYHNLPATHAQAPYAASAEAFRKHGLIASGHCDTFCHAFESMADMMVMGKILKREAEGKHGYALCFYSGNVLTLSTPHSQSFKAMGKDLFHKSVADVEAWAETLIGVRDPEGVKC